MNPINAIIVRARAARLFALGALFGLCLAAASAQEVGQVNFVQGVTSAQSPGGQPRFLAKGDAIAQGEVVSTSERGYAVLGLKDGTKLTLRSNTAFAVDELNQQAGSESLAMNLFRGGLRAITRLISKSRSNSTRLIAPNATIGIRGTEFDARLCGVECRREAQFARPPPPAARQDEVVARVVALNGDASALGRDGATRALANGAAVFNGESVRTGPDSHAVLAFRDQTKVTLIEKTAFNLEDVRMTGSAAQGSFVARLVSGGLRAVTGLIGRTNRGNVKIVTATATIGIRGTGLDLRLLPDGTYLYTWDGAAALEADGSELVVDKDRAGVLRVAGGVLQLLDTVPAAFLDERAPRPDQVEVDFDALFAVRRFDDMAPGLYVGVRKGNVNLRSGAGFFVDLGPFEAAFLAEGGNRPVRIEPLPGLLFNDPFPLPDEAELRPLRLIELVGPGRLSGSDQCLMQ
ncbi:MAG: FecR domain-containing protein [Sulfuritalea sp.]|nr:FecR domain-containing protein [Sulfuritalea sp.]